MYNMHNNVLLGTWKTCWEKVEKKEDKNESNSRRVLMQSQNRDRITRCIVHEPGLMLCVWAWIAKCEHKMKKNCYRRALQVHNLRERDSIWSFSMWRWSLRNSKNKNDQMPVHKKCCGRQREREREREWPIQMLISSCCWFAFFH